MSANPASTNSSLPIVDVWAQPPMFQLEHELPEVVQLLKASNSPLWGYRKRLEDQKLAQTAKNIAALMVSEMDRGGVDRVMLCGWHRPGKVLTSNELILEYIQLYPHRFCGVVSVDLDHPLQAVKDIEHYVTKHNFVAVRVVPWLWNKPITHRYYYPLFVKCIELDIPFCTQVGHTGPLCPSEVGRPIPYVDRVALDFPDLKLVCGHIGYPWTDEMIAVAWKHKNVYIDTSAYLPAYYPKQLLQFMSAYGQHKVMFGTNFPQLSFAKCTASLKRLPSFNHIKNEKAKKMFLYENACRVFKLSATAKQVQSSTACDTNHNNSSGIPAKL